MSTLRQVTLLTATTPSSGLHHRYTAATRSVCLSVCLSVCVSHSITVWVWSLILLICCKESIKSVCHFLLVPHSYVTDITLVSRWHHAGITLVLRWYCTHITLVSHWYQRDITLIWCHSFIVLITAAWYMIQWLWTLRRVCFIRSAGKLWYLALIPLLLLHDVIRWRHTAVNWRTQFCLKFHKTQMWKAWSQSTSD